MVMPTASRVVVFGDVIDDIVVRPHGPIRTDTDTTASINQRPGGSAANVAAWLGELKVPVDFIGRVAEADLLRHAAFLEAHGVTAHLIGDRDLVTGTIVLLIDEENHRTMLTERGANFRLVPADVTDRFLEQAAALHFTGYTVFNGLGNPRASPREFHNLIERAAAHRAVVSVDPGSAGFLADFGVDQFMDAVGGADIIFPNLDEGRVLTGQDNPLDIAGDLASRFPTVVLTLGARGTVIATKDAPPVFLSVAAKPLADATGAGDAFCAGFLQSWLGEGDPISAAHRGWEVALRALASIGGRPN